MPIPDSFQTPESCPHERRPGTTVCLHCRHAARLVARAQRRHVLLRGGFGVLGALFLLGGGTLSTYVARGYVQRRGVPTTSIAPRRPVATVAIQQQGGAVAIPTIASASALEPIVRQGETMLADSVRAVRSDSGVTVLFDRPMIRTRRPEKFERFVRATLPAIYGRKLDSLLTMLPTGAISDQGDLLTELPSRGARLALANGWKITLWPETRPGDDGPLVIRYRVAVR